MLGAMKVHDELYVLELPLMGRVMNLSLISTPGHGLTLVDAGLPGQADLIEDAVRAEGLNLSDIKQIVLTHQDLDHIGSLAELKERTGARVYALREEIPYIDGTLRSVKFPSPERLAQNPEFAAMINALQRTTVDEAVDDGQTLEFCGATVVATPGIRPAICRFTCRAPKLCLREMRWFPRTGNSTARWKPRRRTWPQRWNR